MFWRWRGDGDSNSKDIVGKGQRCGDEVRIGKAKPDVNNLATLTRLKSVGGQTKGSTVTQYSVYSIRAIHKVVCRDT